MDPERAARLRSWLARPGSLSLPAAEVDALARALAAPDPPVTAGRWGSAVLYAPGPPRRRIAELGDRDELLAELRWSGDGSLAWARCLTAWETWVGIEPRAATHPGWGVSDRVWLLGPGPGWNPREALTVFQSVDYAQPDFVPPLADPARLPPGAGTAILNLLAGLMKDQGVVRARYRGPYPTEQLFTSLLESFRYDASAEDPLGAFIDGGGLDWHPAPFEQRRARPGLTVQLRQEIDKVVVDGVAFYRRDWQGVLRREPRALRQEGERVVCSLWALGRPLENRVVLDGRADVIEERASPPDAAAPAPFEPVWNAALADLIARESAPALAGPIGHVMARLALEWGPVPGDLLAVRETGIRVSRSLRDAGRGWIGEVADQNARVERAGGFALEVARLIGPAVRARAQGHLASLPADLQERALAEPTTPPSLGASVGRLLALLLRQSA